MVGHNAIPTQSYERVGAGKGGLFGLGSDFYIKATSVCLSLDEEGGARSRLQPDLGVAGGVHV